MADRRLAVIEDVVSSGGQLIESCAALRERGADIAAVVCVIDRERRRGVCPMKCVWSG